MPRFFFDFHQEDSYCRDRDGCTFATADQAFLGAFEAAKDMWSELLGKREDPRCCSFDIRNERGEIVYILPLSEVLESCRDAKWPAGVPSSVMRGTVHDVRHAERLVVQLQYELLLAQASLQRSRNLLLESRLSAVG